MTTDKTIILASNNGAKVREINQLLHGTGLTVIPQSEYAVEAAAETACTFVENALIKARHASTQTGHAAIADDSGIEVMALNGQPGVYSARYAGEGASDEDNLDKLMTAVQAIPEAERQARYVCVMVFLKHADDPTPLITMGIWEGTLLTEPRGENGFGYDPMFYVEQYQCTSAELSPTIKNQLSHRGQALRALVEKIKTI